MKFVFRVIAFPRRLSRPVPTSLFIRHLYNNRKNLTKQKKNGIHRSTKPVDPQLPSGIATTSGGGRGLFLLQPRYIAFCAGALLFSTNLVSNDFLLAFPPKVIMSSFAKVKMSSSQLQCPPVRGRHNGRKGLDHNESQRIKPVVCYTPDDR